MKIAIIIPELLKEGGGERQCVYLAKELQELGHEVVVYTLEYAVDKCFPDICPNLDIRTTNRSTLTKLRVPFPYTRIKEFFDMRHMAKEIKEGFDILNPHAWPPHWAAIHLKRKLKVPVVWMCNDFMVRRKNNLRHKGVLEKAKGLLANLRHAFLFKYDYSVVNDLDKIIVLSNGIKRMMEDSYNVEARVIRSGVDLSKFKYGSNDDEIRKKHGIRKDEFLLLSVSIMFPQRRMEDVIVALSILIAKSYNVKLLIVGSLSYDISYSNDIIFLAKGKGLEKAIIFTGDVPEAEIPRYYQACDVYIHPNEEQTWGLAVTEAMACQKPVIVSTGAGVHEVLKDYQTALLIPPRRPDLIAAKVEELMNNPELRVRIAKQGYDFVHQNLSWKRYAESMVNVFEEVLKQENSR